METEPADYSKIAYVDALDADPDWNRKKEKNK